MPSRMLLISAPTFESACVRGVISMGRGFAGCGGSLDGKGGGGAAETSCTTGAWGASWPVFPTSFGGMIFAAASFTCGQSLAGRPLGICCLDGEIIPPFLVDFFQHDRHKVAFFHCFRNVADSKRRDFRDVDEAFRVRADFHERAEVHHAGDRSFK